jgi:outer membrane protein assembly factor BamB
MMPLPGRSLATVGLAAVLAVCTGASLTGVTASATRTTSTAIDWDTYGGSLTRDGSNPSETTLTPATVGRLKQKWAYKMAAVVMTPPVEAAGVSTSSGLQNLVYAGDEHGNLVALNETTGALVWTRNIGSLKTTCLMTPDGVWGVTAAPVIDRTGNLIYAVGGTGDLYALDLGTGAVKSGWPVSLTNNPKREEDWGALSLSNGEVYVVIASNCDGPGYHGRVVEVSAAMHSVTATFYVIPPSGSKGPNGGGIWGWGGASIDPAANGLYVSTGNATTMPENIDYAESVVRLTTGLALVAFDKPSLKSGRDLDFGSTPVLYQVSGCPTQLAVQNKDGELFVYDRDTIGSGPVQRIQVIPSTGLPFVGVPAWSDATQLLYVSLTRDTSTYKHGMLAFSETAPSCTLTKSWNTVNGKASTNDSPPTEAGGVVYNGNGKGNKLYAYNATTGAVLWNSGSALTGAAFSPPTVVNGMVFAGAWDDELHAFGL